MERPDLIEAGEERLSWIERANIRFVRSTLVPGRMDRVLRLCQQTIGSGWIYECTKNLLHVDGVERLPELSTDESYICVANHRSFFDLYVVTSYLIRQQGLRNRIIFPVRSKFFYTRGLGLAVNGAMSFFAMYPPIFRERSQIRLNVTSLADLAWLTNRGGAFVGFHPEGTRNQGDDPYALLPPQRGVGQLVHATNAKVIPVFINGLRTEGLGRQVASNFDGTGDPIIIVFGDPIDFDELRAKKPSIKVQAAIAKKTIDEIAALGERERQLRAELVAG
jgi:1-acyl-sn-glycerol-3-phosphate acyltransferase